jgi:hypothetical protein
VVLNGLGSGAAATKSVVGKAAIPKVPKDIALNESLRFMFFFIWMRDTRYEIRDLR